MVAVRTPPSLRTVFPLLGLVTLACFLFFTLAIFLGRFVYIDFNLMVKIQDHVPVRADRFLATIVDLGSIEITSILFLVALVLLRLPKRYKLMLVCAYLLGLAVVVSGKLFISHPAPPFMFQRHVENSFSFPSTHVQIDSSYPSGHTYRTIFVTTMFAIWILSSNWRVEIKGIVMATFGGIASLVLIALVVLGKHWVSDVIGGGCLAFGLASLISLWIVKKDSVKFSKTHPG